MWSSRKGRGIGVFRYVIIMIQFVEISLPDIFGISGLLQTGILLSI